jgi:hypothetical protein
MPIVITAGQREDFPQFELVLENIRVPRQGSGASTRAAGQSARRQGVRLPVEPCLPAPTWDLVHDPGEEGPGPQP